MTVYKRKAKRYYPNQNLSYILKNGLFRLKENSQINLVINFHGGSIAILRAFSSIRPELYRKFQRSKVDIPKIVNF